MPDLMHLTIGKSKPAVLSEPPQGAGPGFIPAGCPLGSASTSSYPAVPDVSLGTGLGTDGLFGSLRVTSDLQSQMETDSSFVPSMDPPDGLQNFSVLPAPAPSALPDPLELSSTGDIQNPANPQNQQPCKYDLLSSIPRESGSTLSSPGFLVHHDSSQNRELFSLHPVLVLGSS